MSIDTIVATIDDGGENTAAEVRTLGAAIYESLVTFRPASWGKSVTYSTSPDSSYNDIPPLVLTAAASDWATTGSLLTTFNENMGFLLGVVGWNDLDVAVKVDLGAVQQVDKMTLLGYNGTDLIYCPTAVTLLSSTDDVSYATVVTKASLGDGGQQYKQMWIADFDVSAAAQARYWRWDLTHKSGGWIMLHRMIATAGSDN